MFSPLLEDTVRVGYFNNLSSLEKVESESVGQYVDAKDSNGREIFGGDILKVKRSSGTDIGSVVVKDGGILFDSDGYSFLSDVIFYADEVEVIGNTFQNPELLD